VLSLAFAREHLSVLCLGAHSDDIEIGAGGTLLTLIQAGCRLDVHWCVLSAIGDRAREAEASANDLLRGAVSRKLEILEFQDGYFGYHGARLKTWFEDLKGRVHPDVVLTHRRDDAHQDHREVSQLTWNSFRNHLILEYEIPKWDGDLAPMNAYMPLSNDVLERKVAILLRHFGSQRSKDWFDSQTFMSLARLRGMECRASEGCAEAFVIRKARLCA
jgi:LmbE family N-acetylglucosaminyl deacetylase